MPKTIAGRKNKRVNLQKSISDVWTNFASVWGEVRPLTSRDIYSEDVIQKASHVIGLRYRSDIKQNQRVTLGTRKFLVHAIKDVNDRKEIDLAVQELVGWTAIFFVETGTYAPATGITTFSGLVQHTEDIIPPKDFPQAYDTIGLIELGGGLIESGEIEITLPAGGITFTPATGMRVDFNSLTWKVTGISKRARGDSITSYGIKLER